MNFSKILYSIEHNKHYLNRYIKFIKWCESYNLENKITKQSSYMESHHICPGSKLMFPEYRSFVEFPWNKIDLTARQHFLAHWMLWKAYNNQSTAKAFYFMKKTSSNQQRYFKITARVFESLKLTHKQFRHTEESKHKISATLKQRYKSGEITISQRNRDICREYQRNRIWTKESKEKSSKTKIERGSSKGLNNSQFGIRFKWMNNCKINKKVPLIDVKTFELNGWVFGRIKV